MEWLPGAVTCGEKPGLSVELNSEFLLRDFLLSTKMVDNSLVLCDQVSARQKVVTLRG
jgi:hypothetical protein